MEIVFVVLYLMIHKLTGWWYTYPSEKYDFVRWDDDIPTIKAMFETTNQF